MKFTANLLAVVVAIAVLFTLMGKIFFLCLHSAHDDVE